MGKSIGVVLSHSTDFGSFCASLMEKFRIPIKILTPGELYEDIDVVILYSNEGLPPQHVSIQGFRQVSVVDQQIITTANPIPLKYGGDSILDEWVRSGSLDYYLTRSCIIAVESATAYICKLVGGQIIPSANIYQGIKDRVYLADEMQINNMEVVYPTSIVDIDSNNSNVERLVYVREDDGLTFAGKTDKIGFTTITWRNSNILEFILKSFLNLDNNYSQGGEFTNEESVLGPTINPTASGSSNA